MPATLEHPKDFGSSFDKARRSYGLFAAILLAFELVGVELQPKPVSTLELTLKSPDAVPYVLIALVLYFGARLTIEWFQTDSRRRRLLPSKIDFIMAHGIGAASLVLFTWQTLARVQLFNSTKILATLSVAVSAGVMFVAARALWKRLRSDRLFASVWRPFPPLLMLASLLWAFSRIVALAPVGRTTVVLAATVGMALTAGAMAYLTMLERESARVTAELKREMAEMRERLESERDAFETSSM